LGTGLWLGSVRRQPISYIRKMALWTENSKYVTKVIRLSIHKASRVYSRLVNS